MPFGPTMRTLWKLDPTITYLNHGTVGATPIPVLDAQQTLRDRIERQPSRFMSRELFAGSPSRWTAQPLLRAAADRVADVLGARGQDLVFVQNATTGINAVLQSFPLEPGDTIVLTSFGYGSFPALAEHVAARRGLRVHTIALPFPVADADALFDAFMAGLPTRAGLVVVDLIASGTGVRLPIERIVAACRERGVPVCVDGAHAPGHVPVDLTTLGADLFVGNLHKWMWTPRSSAVLWCHPRWQDHLRPPVLSWGLGHGFIAEFDVAGTRDPTCHLCAPAALDLFDAIGMDAVQQHNHALAVEAGGLLADAWGTERLAPADCLGAMVPVRLPYALDGNAMFRYRDRLLDEHRIEVHLARNEAFTWARVGLQIYNDLDDVRRLASVVRDCRPAGV